MTEERKYLQNDVVRRMGLGLQIGASVGILVGLFLGSYCGIKYSESLQTEATHRIEQKYQQEIKRIKTYSESQPERR